MVTTFAISLGVIFILQIAAGAYAYSKRKELDHYAKKGLENAVNEYSKEEYQKAMDHVQEEFDCCGASGYEDYLRSRVSNSTKFPKSCCRNQTVCPDDFLAARRANKTVFVTEVSTTERVDAKLGNSMFIYLLLFFCWLSFFLHTVY